MRLYLSLPLLLLAGPASAQPPRQQSPAPRDVLAAVGSGNTDAALAQAIAEAGAHPLGTLANPVRVAGPEGERAYLARLRCSDGRAPTIGTRSAAGVGAYGSLVDAYALDCGPAAPGKVSLVMDRYHEENQEARAPAGFRIGR
ncbi:MAG TPA: hypothetical protein VF631_10690 [Allosphingosinicella sp.]|jgi:hypothetical protein|uniref:hypothetical protein n=1 Tax=Allosphingosinicella sp. TaxID=2823234 RepID=UPI002F2A8D5E